jgi:hypothetical protein
LIIFIGANSQLIDADFFQLVRQFGRSIGGMALK